MGRGREVSFVHDRSRGEYPSRRLPLSLSDVATNVPDVFRPGRPAIRMAEELKSGKKDWKIGLGEHSTGGKNEDGGEGILINEAIRSFVYDFLYENGNRSRPKAIYPTGLSTRMAKSSAK